MKTIEPIAPLWSYTSMLLMETRAQWGSIVFSPAFQLSYYACSIQLFFCWSYTLTLLENI